MAHSFNKPRWVGRYHFLDSQAKELGHVQLSACPLTVCILKAEVMLDLSVRHLQPETWLGITIVQARDVTKLNHSRGNSSVEGSTDSSKIWEVKLVGPNMGRMQTEAGVILRTQACVGEIKSNKGRG